MHLTPPHLEVFLHDSCRLSYQADVFWVTEAIGQEQLDAMRMVFSYDRNGAVQPVIEVNV